MNAADHAAKRVTKDEAIRRLIEAGHSNVASLLDQWRDKNGRNWVWDGHVRKWIPKFVPIIWTAALMLAILLPSLADAATRCRTSRSGSTTYTTCEGGDTKTTCRSSRSGSTTYTSCQQR